MRWFWAAGGYIAVGLAFLGVFLPLLPTVPFLLLAAYCFARSSERMHNWLLSHSVFGPPIENWSRSGAIARPAKRIASVSMLAVLVLSAIMGLRPMILAIQVVVMGCVALFIWTRPEA